MPPVQMKLMFFIFLTIFPPTTLSLDSLRSRFNHIGDPCVQKVCFISTKNLTFCNVLEYQKTESTCDPRKRHDFYGSRDIGPTLTFIIPEDHSMMTFLCFESNTSLSFLFFVTPKEILGALIFLSLTQPYAANDSAVSEMIP